MFTSNKCMLGVTIVLPYGMASMESKALTKKRWFNK